MAKNVPARAVRTIVFDEWPNHETIWAIAAGPDNLIHVAVCCETTGGGSVQLYAYDPATDAMRHLVDGASALNEPPETGRATHGKVHFALCPSTDGYVYAATHASTAPLGDHIWDARAMWADHTRRFSGGHFFRYDPVTGACEDYGVPFPFVGLPAMELDEALGCFVAVTYPTGHVVFIDKVSRQATDGGRISETYPLCLVLDGQGHAWTSDTYGFLVRINVRERTTETLEARVPQPSGSTGPLCCMCDARLGADGYVYGISYARPGLYRFLPTPAGPVEIEFLGRFLPGAERGMGRGLCFADDGMIYACHFDAHSASENIHLVRYDPKRQRFDDLGVLASRGASRRWWRCVKGPDGKLYAGECGRKPVSLIVIDPKRL